MDILDQNQAARVWQRVRGQSGAEDTLEDLINDAWHDTALFLQLSRRTEGKSAAALRRLYEQEQSQWACLRGIHAMTTGRKWIQPQPRPIPGGLEENLRSCLSRRMRTMNVCQSRGSDAEYGCVYVQLAEKERQQCRVILELIGSLRERRR